MLSFGQIVFRKFLTLFIVLFVLVGASVYYWEKELYIKEIKNSLLQDVELVALTINKQTNIDTLANKIKKQLHLRVTIINEDGTVIAESDNDKSQMQNHKNRPEVVQADKNEFGFSVRDSQTVNKHLLYVVKKYNIDGHKIYIRLSKELDNNHEHILKLGIEVLSILGLFFLTMFYVTYKLNQQINKETTKIVDFLKSLTKKKKESYISSNFSQEFSLITKLLTKISKILIKQNKQKDKYTARLKLANTQKDDIISAISHEFKNPIAIISGYTQTLLDDPELNRKIQHKFLTNIYKNANRINTLIDTLRLSTKLDTLEHKLNLKTINIYDLVYEISENLRLTYKNKELKIDGVKTLEIKVDENLFSIALTNLIENAFKYSEDEVVVKISPLKIDIIDTGIGISQKDLPMISEKFYRVSTNSWNNSLGLGLFLVNNILKLHKFKLDIKSVENEGSTFSVLLKDTY